MYMRVLDHAGRRTHHVVEASEEGDVCIIHLVVDLSSSTSCSLFRSSILLNFC